MLAYRFRRLFSLLPILLAGSVQAEMIDIDSAELTRLQKSGVPVVDIRTAPEWEETGIVAGSRLLTFFDERGRYDARHWLQQLKTTASPDQAVILICRTGNRTRIVGQMLSQQAGYAKVYNVKSGIKGWQRDGGAVIPVQPTLAACRADKTC
ncbi:rhodanese-like domain-containing protein [Dechloromonas sp. ZY10]|uniref:rhodanese-like domain-containing protein n=1 Tax=Dechloromonas aquae TaxID=2664436 RepID=UPI0035272131